MVDYEKSTFILNIYTDNIPKFYIKCIISKIFSKIKKVITKLNYFSVILKYNNWSKSLCG